MITSDQFIIHEGKEFVIRLRHNLTDDRWTYTIDGIEPEEMVYPTCHLDLDEFGSEQWGQWNSNTTGFLDELMDCIKDEVDAAYNYPADSYEYDTPD